MKTVKIILLATACILPVALNGMERDGRQRLTAMSISGIRYTQEEVENARQAYAEERTQREGQEEVNFAAGRLLTAIDNQRSDNQAKGKNNDPRNCSIM